MAIGQQAQVGVDQSLIALTLLLLKWLRSFEDASKTNTKHEHESIGNGTHCVAFCKLARFKVTGICS